MNTSMAGRHEQRETHDLIGSDKVEGTNVYRSNGEKIGEIERVMLEKRSGKLYWSDREGMRVMRSNLDGSQIETLVDASDGTPRPGTDAKKWCVGIAVFWDAQGGDPAWCVSPATAERANPGSRSRRPHRCASMPCSPEPCRGQDRRPRPTTR